MTLEEIQAAVRKLDPKADGDSFDTAVMMLAAIELGANARRLAAFTGKPTEWVAERGRRLREAGIWVAHGKTRCNWFEEGGGLEFWMDVAVAQGLLEKRWVA